MFNRGDLRMLTVIVGTAILTAIATVAVVKIRDPRTSSLEERVSRLEMQSLPPALPWLAPPPPAPPPPPPPVPCDEVSCVLENYKQVCCAQFRKVPDALDHVAISDGIAGVRAQVSSCNDMNATGIAKVEVKVSPEGTVTSVVVMKAPNSAIAACVANTMQLATFTPTMHGGSFTYPFKF
jgi:hypothetical protein